MRAGGSRGLVGLLPGDRVWCDEPVTDPDNLDRLDDEDDLDDLDRPRALGEVPTAGRGGLPFALLHGEALVTIASWALGDAGVDLLDFTATWPQVREVGQPLVLHDPLCPLTPVGFLREAVRRCRVEDAVVVGVRPVTDTIKTVAGDVVGETVDRDSLHTVCSPVVLPASVVAALEDWPDLDDFAALVTTLRERFPVMFLEAPALGRRVEDESAVALLTAFAEEQGA